jgi:hypothetical protein
MSKDQVAFSTDELKADGNAGDLIPLSDPFASVSWKADKISEIHVEMLTELSSDMLESIREWLQEILDAWPNRPKE